MVMSYFDDSFTGGDIPLTINVERAPQMKYLQIYFVNTVIIKVPRAPKILHKFLKSVITLQTWQATVKASAKEPMFV